MYKRVLSVFAGILGVASVAAYIGWKGYQAFWNSKAPAPKPNKKYIACLGDSITFGSGVIRTRDTDSYPAQLQRFVGDSWQVLNYGLSGRTLLDQGDHPYRKENFYSISKQVPAHIYILMLGTNDSKPYNWKGKEEYSTQLVNLIQEYQSLPQQPTVVVMQPPKAFPQGKDKPIVYDIQDDIIYDEIKPCITQAIQQTKAHYIDLYSLTEEHPEYFQDGVHPNAYGNNKIAIAVYDYLNTNELL